MKKYILTLLAVVAAFASCTKFASDEEIAFVPISAPSVSAKAVGDSTIVVTLAINEGTTYYSYVIAEGEAEAISAAALLKGKPSVSAIKVEGVKTQDVVKVEETKAKVTEEEWALNLELKGLKPNTYYTIYAVACNAQGVVSELASSTAKTADGTAPQVIDYGAEEADSVLVFSVVFDDPVEATGEGVVSAHFYAENYADQSDALVEIAKVDLEAECVTSKDGMLCVSIPKACYIPGAIVDITWTEGVAKNAVLQRCAAFEDCGLVYNAKGQLVPNGLAAQYDYVNFALSYFEEDEESGIFEDDEEIEIDPVYFQSWSELSMISHSRAAGMLAWVDKKNAEVTVYVKDINGSKSEYPASVALSSASSVVVTFPSDYIPQSGIPHGYASSVSYKIGAGSVVDIFGNKNLEFELEDVYVFSYGYSLDDVIGTYVINSTSAYAAYGYGPYADVITISKSDDAKKGNIMFNGTFAELPVKIYADFDTNAGQIVIPGASYVGRVEDYVYGNDGQPLVGEDGNPVLYNFYVTLALSNGSSIYGNDLGFEVPAPHTLVPYFKNVMPWGIVECTLEGNKLSPYNIYDLVQPQTVEYKGPEAPAVASVAKAHRAKNYVALEIAERL